MQENLYVFTSGYGYINRVMLYYYNFSFFACFSQVTGQYKVGHVTQTRPSEAYVFTVTL